MPSSFGWLDNDDDQRRRMIEIVELFREQGTIDELGIGSIRDTLSNTMFPGTSTLHTRLRYVLFIPWLLQRASAKRTPAEMATEFRELEYRLIDSLTRGGEDEGVQGNVARRNLKRLPSTAYWSSLGQWGLVDAPSSESYFRRQSDIRALTKRAATADDPEAREVLPTWGIDPHLPAVPSDLMNQAIFALSDEEEDFLSARIAAATEGTLLSWLVRNPPENLGAGLGDGGARAPWQIANLSDLDDERRAIVEHAQTFSTLIHGAALVYNLLLARKARRDEMVDKHSAALAAWHADEDPVALAAAWERQSCWQTITENNRNLRSLTRTFVDDWVTLVATGADPGISSEAERLISNRERQIKGARARLFNQAALDKFSGESGLGRLTYRWNVTRSHLEDLYDARSAA